MAILFDTTSRVAEAERFLNVLFGSVKGEVYSYLWTKQDKATYPFKVSDADARKLMARRAVSLSDEGKDVYIGVNGGSEPAQAGQRYTASQVTLQTATVTDIDVEGGNHSSTANKIYPPNFAVAKNFLPFDTSLVVDSGHGLHAYCVYSEPINITALNRAACETRNRKFIEAVRRRAGVFGKAVDGVGDLPRVLRVPGTYNYRLGRDNPPLCKLVEVNDIRFTPADMDERLAALETKPVSIQQKDVKSSKPHRDYQPTGSEPTDIERARAMLEVIPCEKQTYEDWVQVGMILKNTGNDVADWTNWSRADERFKDGETERKWQGFTRGGLTIATLHLLAALYGYSEKDFRREWHNLRGIKSARRPINDEPARADVGGEAQRDNLIDSLFNGNRSDLAFARRLEIFCGDRVKWCNEVNRWYTYSGGFWTQGGSENSSVSHFAADLAETLQQHASTDAEQKIADKFQSAKKIGSAINLLKARHSVRITLDDLDNHAELLNCLNGVVDLQTGKLYPADPSLLITQQCRAAYDPNATAPLVEEFFKAIEPDEETRAGLIRWLAYNLTGENCEEKFAIWTGERGANGKGTLGGTLLELLGSYATGLAPRALLKTNRPADANAATTSLNSIEGVRFAISEEMPLDGELDSSLVKNLTGGDRINLRRNFGEYRTVVNVAKINISGNFAPRIENVNDGGIRRRMINFAFSVNFGTVDHPADPLLKKKLIQPANLRGLLALLVREAALWYRDGLIVSPLMTQATERHLSENDFVADFISDYYVRVADASVKAKAFIDELKAEYPRECSRFKRKDLVKLIAAQDGITYGEDSKSFKVFKGIGKAARDEFDGEPIGRDVVTPYD